ncbi:hypothetical protein ACWD0A_27820 [Streptomyces sp. NPDC002867]
MGPRLGLQLVLGAFLAQGQTLPMEHRRAVRVQGGRDVGDGAELVLAVAVDALLDACGACRTVLEESGGQGAVEGDILAACTRPSSVGWRTFRNNEGSAVAPGTRRKA